MKNPSQILKIIIHGVEGVTTTNFKTYAFQTNITLSKILNILVHWREGVSRLLLALKFNFHITLSKILEILIRVCVCVCVWGGGLGG
jgi:hypothetical protein